MAEIILQGHFGLAYAGQLSGAQYRVRSLAGVTVQDWGGTGVAELATEGVNSGIAEVLFTLPAGFTAGIVDWRDAATPTGMLSDPDTLAPLRVQAAGSGVTVGALTSAERAAVADALLDRVDGVETGWTLRQALRVIAAGIAGKISGAGTATVTFRNLTDSKARITATVDDAGNRLSVTPDGS